MRKLVPFSPNEIGETTQWLNDLAQDGLCVETWGSVFVKLKEGESKDWAKAHTVHHIKMGDPFPLSAIRGTRRRRRRARRPRS